MADYKYPPKAVIENNYKGYCFQSVGKPFTKQELEEQYNAIKGVEKKKETPEAYEPDKKKKHTFSKNDEE